MENGSSHFNKWCWNNWISICQKIEIKKELQSIPPTYIKINSKWITNLNVKSKPIKFLEENIRENLFNLRFAKYFFDVTPKLKRYC